LVTGRGAEGERTARLAVGHPEEAGVGPWRKTDPFRLGGDVEADRVGKAGILTKPPMSSPLIAPVRAGELDEPFRQAAKTSAVGWARHDRGPFVKGRYIDLSTGAARVLGIAGTAMVSLRRRTTAGLSDLFTSKFALGHASQAAPLASIGRTLLA
jgi:hypothetical protein